jgi:hypothetical protein
VQVLGGKARFQNLDVSECVGSSGLGPLSSFGGGMAFVLGLEPWMIGYDSVIDRITLRDNRAGNGAALYVDSRQPALNFFSGTLVHVHADCSMLPPNGSLIAGELGAPPLPLKGLNISGIPADGCPAAELLAGATLTMCSELYSTKEDGQRGPCAPTATCSEADVLLSDTLRSTECSCSSAVGAVVSPKASDMALAPYLLGQDDGCVVPLKATVQRRITSVFEKLTKNKTHADSISLSVLLEVDGTDWQSPLYTYSWAILENASTPDWLSLPMLNGSVSPPLTGSSNLQIPLPMTLSSANLKSGPHTTHVKVAFDMWSSSFDVNCAVPCGAGRTCRDWMLDATCPKAASVCGSQCNACCDMMDMPRQVISVPVNLIVAATPVASNCRTMRALPNQTAGTWYQVNFESRDVDNLVIEEATNDVFTPRVSFCGNLDGGCKPLTDKDYPWQLSYHSKGVYFLDFMFVRFGYYQIEVLCNNVPLPVSVNVSMLCPAGFGIDGVVAGNSTGSCSCAPGYERTPDGSDCVVCAAGTYKVTLGDSSCQPCPSSRLTSRPGASSVDECVCHEGFFLYGADETNCHLCPRSTGCFPPDINHGTPLPGATANDTGTGSGQPGTNVSAWGVTLANLPIKPNYWRLSNRTSVGIRRCSGGDGDDDDDDGHRVTVTACAGGVRVDDYCVDGTTGPMCTICRERYQIVDADTATCVPCSFNRGSLAFTLSLLMIALAGVVVMFHPSMQRRRARLVSLASQLRTVARRIGLIGKLKQLIAYYQVVLAIPQVYRVTVPTEYSALMAVFSILEFDWFGSILPSECWGSSATQLTISATFPFLLILLIVASRAAYDFYNTEHTVGDEESSGRRPTAASVDGRSARPSIGRSVGESGKAHLLRPSGAHIPSFGCADEGPGEHGGAHDHDRRTPCKLLIGAVLRTMPLILTLLFFFLPSVSRYAFSAFACDAFPYDDTTAEDWYYLHQNYRIRCSMGSFINPEHETLKGLSYLYVFLWPVGMTILFTALLVASRHEAPFSSMRERILTFGSGRHSAARTAKRGGGIAPHKDQERRLARAIEFLTQEYREELYYWEVFEVLRKLALSGFLLLTPESATFLRLIVAVLLSVSYMVLVLAVKPFKQQSTAFVALSAQLSLSSTLFTALVLRVLNIASNSRAAAELFKAFGISSPNPLIGLMLLANFGLLILVLCFLVREAVLERWRNMLLSPAEYAALTDILHSNDAHTPCGGDGGGCKTIGGGGDATSSCGGVELVSSVVRTVRRRLSSVKWGGATHQLALNPNANAHSKHCSDARELVMGKPVQAARGLHHFMGVADPFAVDGVERIEREVEAFVASVRALEPLEVVARYRDVTGLGESASAAEVVDTVVREVQGNLHYILYEQSSEVAFSNGVRDAGRAFGQFCKGRETHAHELAHMVHHPMFFLDEQCAMYRKHRPAWDALPDAEKAQLGVSFDHFVQHPTAREAQLEPAHVLALRLYTTHAFKYINNPLRDTEHYGTGKAPHPLALTVLFITEGIKRLRSVYILTYCERATKQATLWRGMRGVRVSPEFLENRTGGTELAPMSTTKDIRVAARYALSGVSLLLKLRVNNFVQFGATLQWLSAFPAEKEVLYPPLSYLQPTGLTQLVEVGGHKFTVVEVQPHIA